jgi:hypothetical protein
VPRKEALTPRHPVPAFSGIPECPDLSLPPPPAFPSAQTLHRLRAQVLAQPDLQVDIFSIVDAMVVRFEAAKEEMAAAQGGVWENDTWDLAAEHTKIKKLKIEKWCEINAIVVGKGRNPLADAFNGIDGGTEGNINILGGQTIDSLDWPVPSNDPDIMHWESNLFDEIMRDFPTGVLLDTSGDWGAGVLDGMGLMGEPAIGEDVQH